jgi:hypothetical protein
VSDVLNEGIRDKSYSDSKRSVIYVFQLRVARSGTLLYQRLATGPTGHSIAGSNPTEGGGFLWVIEIPSTHFLRRESKAVGPMS